MASEEKTTTSPKATSSNISKSQLSHCGQIADSRDYVQETNDYLIDKIQSLPSDPEEWQIYHHSVPEHPQIPNIRGGALCDIGTDSLISIGGRSRNPNVDVYQIHKSFNSIHALPPNPNSSTIPGV